MGLRCNIDNLLLFEPIFETQNQSEQHGKPLHLPEVLWQYHVYHCPNNNIWLIEATGMGDNGCNMPNDGSLALFRTMGGVVGPRGDTMKNWRFCSYSNFGDKHHRFHLPAEL